MTIALFFIERREYVAFCTVVTAPVTKKVIIVTGLEKEGLRVNKELLEGVGLERDPRLNDHPAATCSLSRLFCRLRRSVAESSVTRLAHDDITGPFLSPPRPRPSPTSSPRATRCAGNTRPPQAPTTAPERAGRLPASPRHHSWTGSLEQGGRRAPHGIPVAEHHETTPSMRCHLSGGNRSPAVSSPRDGPPLSLH
jgi:hypothetical protein